MATTSPQRMVDMGRGGFQDYSFVLGTLDGRGRIITETYEGAIILIAYQYRPYPKSATVNLRLCFFCKCALSVPRFHAFIAAASVWL